MLESFDETNDGKAEVVFRIDDDDQDSLVVLSGRPVIVGPRLNGYASMPSFFNEMLDIVSGDVLMCGNDDMIFKTPGWPSLVLEEANKHPDGLFDIGVKAYNEDHYPFWTTSRAVAKRLGFILDPRVFWGDIFIRDVMGAFGGCVKLPSVEIVHDWVGFAPDETFLEAGQGHPSHWDSEYWEETHKPAVAEAIERLRSMARGAAA